MGYYRDLGRLWLEPKILAHASWYDFTSQKAENLSYWQLNQLMAVMQVIFDFQIVDETWPTVTNIRVHLSAFQQMRD